MANEPVAPNDGMTFTQKKLAEKFGDITEHAGDCNYRRSGGNAYCSCPLFPNEIQIKRALAPDLINHPPYYANLKPEPIDVIESWGLGFNIGNALKYIARAGRKVGAPILQDLRKAAWYLNREIGRAVIAELRQDAQEERERFGDDDRCLCGGVGCNSCEPQGRG